MRGLTPLEREALKEAATYTSPEDLCFADMGDAQINAALIKHGRVRIVPWETATHTGEYYGATDLGRLALRVCPVDE